MEIPFSGTQYLTYNDGTVEEKVFSGTYRTDNALRITQEVDEVPLPHISIA